MAKKSPAKKVTTKAPAKKAPVKKVVKSVTKPVSKKTAKPASKHTAKPVKKAVAKKSAAKKPAAKTKPAPKKALKKISKPAVKKVAKPSPKKAAAPSKKVATPAKKAAPAKAAPAKATAKVSVKAPSKGKVSKAKVIVSDNHRVLAQQFVTKPLVNKNLKLSPFFTKQRQRLLELKDTLLDAMRGVARDNLHAGSETSAFGMHQADAGSDAYDRDFALSMLSKEQSSLYEIDEALKRIDDGSYGVCDLCEKPIKHDRLEALPFTRYTVDCQAELEKRQHHNSARPQITSLFGLTEEESESEDEETTENS
ncbi:MAG: TraR/DksA C4-type zinc finger protein [Verrucomicrobiota bacterium]